MRPLVALSQRLRHRCLSKSEARVTGTIATAGCEMPLLLCFRCCVPVIARKPNPGGNGFCGQSPEALRRCRSCTVFAANAVSTNSKFHGSQAMKSPRRFASAMPRRKNFTHSKVMAWLAFDRAVKLVEDCGCAAGEHYGRWQKVRDQIHAEVCERGYNARRKAFTQVYGSDALDASLLTVPLVGFLPASDERVRNTIEAIERELMQDGFVLRYLPEECGVDGLPGREGVFLPCSFWLADCWHLDR